jgi:hypothetical protein
MGFNLGACKQENPYWIGTRMMNGMLAVIAASYFLVGEQVETS